MALATQPSLYATMISNIEELKARGAYVIGVGPAECEELDAVCDTVLPLPKTDPMLMPLLTVVPLQLLAYYAAKARDCEIDQPRNLAKSVTVK